MCISNFDTRKLTTAQVAVGKQGTKALMVQQRRELSTLSPDDKSTSLQQHAARQTTSVTGSSSYKQIVPSLADPSQMKRCAETLPGQLSPTAKGSQTLPATPS